MPMRVLAVADVYEALTSERPYRSAWSSDEALEIMRPDVPRRLDHEAFAELEALVEDDETPARRFAAHGSPDSLADGARREPIVVAPQLSSRRASRPRRTKAT